MDSLAAGCFGSGVARYGAIPFARKSHSLDSLVPTLDLLPLVRVVI